jgi:hypothetical protein
MTAAEIAAALGDPMREGRDWRCRCPVHGGCSLTLCDGRDRLLVRCWAGCAARDVLAELRRMGLTGGRSDGARSAPVAVRTAGGADTARCSALARRIWDAARDARGSPVVRYLAARGITVPLPLSLRWAPRCRHPSGSYLPAMVARVDNVDGELIGIHRTYLTADYRRRDRASLGPIAGGAVRLASAQPDDWLVIGEGIEKVMSVMQARGLPGWAALSAGGIERLLLPPEARLVLIVADHDANGIGERAARNAALRWLAEGRRVRIAMPPEPHTDFNDVLLGPAYARFERARDVAA